MLRGVYLSKLLCQICVFCGGSGPSHRHFDLVNCCISGGAGLHVELTAKRTALLVGDTITVTCVARGSEILEDHWKYPGKVVRAQVILCRIKNYSNRLCILVSVSQKLQLFTKSDCKVV